MAAVRYLVRDADAALAFYTLEAVLRRESFAALRSAGARFRATLVSGPGDRQMLAEDPSGHPVELFESRD